MGEKREKRREHPLIGRPIFANQWHKQLLSMKIINETQLRRKLKTFHFFGIQSDELRNNYFFRTLNDFPNIQSSPASGIRNVSSQ